MHMFMMKVTIIEPIKYVDGEDIWKDGNVYENDSFY